MYDFVTVTDSKEQSRVILAYSEPQNGVRRCEYLAEKTFGKFSRTEYFINGESKTDVIDRADFFWAFGAAVGQISCGIPKE